MSGCPIALAAVVIILLLYAKWPDYGRAVLHCLTRYSTLRPCDIDFHDKARATLTSIAMRAHIRIGRAMYRYFEVISIFSIILFIYFLLNLAAGLLECIPVFIVP